MHQYLTKLFHFEFWLYFLFKRNKQICNFHYAAMSMVASKKTPEGADISSVDILFFLQIKKFFTLCKTSH